ncbi:hypothetical protein ACTXT7_017497, partial [Hymenolepis weldensis]
MEWHGVVGLEVAVPTREVPHHAVVAFRGLRNFVEKSPVLLSAVEVIPASGCTLLVGLGPCWEVLGFLSLGEVKVSRSMGKWGSGGSSIVVALVVGLVGADCGGTRVPMPRDEESREEGALDDCRPHLVVVDCTVSHNVSNALFTDAFGLLSTWGYFASFSALLIPRCS